MKLVAPSLEFFQIYECFQYSRDGTSSPFYSISIFVALFAFLVNVFHLRYQRWRQQSLLCYFYLSRIICFPCQYVSFAVPEMAPVIPFMLFLSFSHYLLSLSMCFICVTTDGASSPFYAISIFLALFAFLVNVFHLRYERWRQQFLLFYFYLSFIICFPCFFQFTRYKYMCLKLILICD